MSTQVGSKIVEQKYWFGARFQITSGSNIQAFAVSGTGHQYSRCSILDRITATGLTRITHYSSQINSRCMPRSATPSPTPSGIIAKVYGVCSSLFCFSPAK